MGSFAASLQVPFRAPKSTRIPPYLSIISQIFEKVDAIDADTHTIFIGRMIEADITDDEAPMTYAYYQEHKNDLVKTTTEKGETAWVCKVCGYVYYGDEVPDDYRCPLCGLGKEYFVKKG